MPVVANVRQNAEQRLSSLKSADAEVQNIFVASVSDLLTSFRYTNFRWDKQKRRRIRAEMIAPNPSVRLPRKSTDDRMPFYYQMPVFHSSMPRFLCNSSPDDRPEKFRIWGLTALALLEAFNSLLPEDAKEREASELLKVMRE